MKDALLKSWKTTAVGVVILLYLAYKLFFLGQDMDTQMVIEMLFATGFLTSKDGTASHSKK